jgi:hypothetical protein
VAESFPQLLVLAESLVTMDSLDAATILKSILDCYEDAIGVRIFPKASPISECSEQP